MKIMIRVTLLLKKKILKKAEIFQKILRYSRKKAIKTAAMQ